MNCVLGLDSALARPGTTWAYEMNFVMNHAPVAGSYGNGDDIDLFVYSAITMARS